MVRRGENDLIIFELSGMIAVLICSLIMRRAYELSGGSAAGILFGAVNQSAWEQCKTMLLSYLGWGMLELISAQASTRRMASAKTAGVIVLCAVYLVSRLCTEGSAYGGITEAVISTASVCSGFAVSFMILRLKLNTDGLFFAALSLLFIITAVYFCFTPFPPEGRLFTDPTTGLRGIVPSYLDRGAYVLTANFS